MAQRSFTVPMTEETVIELVNTLESKLAMSALAKEQRALMTKKLREYIKRGTTILAVPVEIQRMPSRIFC